VGGAGWSGCARRSCARINPRENMSMADVNGRPSRT
jgi:hypothetical protein